MKVNYKLILIDRDKMTKIPKVIAPWEIPVYEAIYNEDDPEAGAGFVVNGEVAVEVAEIPSAADERQRLRGLHGLHEKQGVPFVDLAYGRGLAGVAELERAIHAAFPVQAGVGAPVESEAEMRERIRQELLEEMAALQTPEPEPEPEPEPAKPARATKGKKGEPAAADSEDADPLAEQ